MYVFVIYYVLPSGSTSPRGTSRQQKPYRPSRQRWEPEAVRPDGRGDADSLRRFGRRLLVGLGRWAVCVCMYVVLYIWDWYDAAQRRQPPHFVSFNEDRAANLAEAAEVRHAEVCMYLWRYTAEGNRTGINDGAAKAKGRRRVREGVSDNVYLFFYAIRYACRCNLARGYKL